MIATYKFVILDDGSQKEVKSDTIKAADRTGAVEKFEKMQLPELDCLAILFNETQSKILRYRYGRQQKQMDTHEAASVLGVSPQTLYRYVRIKILIPDHTRGGRLFFNEKTIADFKKNVQPTIKRGNPQLFDLKKCDTNTKLK